MLSHKVLEIQNYFPFVFVIYYLTCAILIAPTEIAGADPNFKLVQPNSNFQVGHQTQAPPPLATAATFNIPTISHPHRSSQSHHGQSAPHLSTTASPIPTFQHHHSPQQSRQIQTSSSNVVPQIHSASSTTTTTASISQSTTYPSTKAPTITTPTPALVATSSDISRIPTIHSTPTPGAITTPLSAALGTTVTPNVINRMDEFTPFSTKTTTQAPRIPFIYAPQPNRSFDGAINLPMDVFNEPIPDRHNLEHPDEDHQNSPSVSNPQVSPDPFAQADSSRNPTIDVGNNNAESTFLNSNSMPGIDTRKPQISNITDGNDNLSSSTTTVSAMDYSTPLMENANGSSTTNLTESTAMNQAKSSSVAEYKPTVIDSDNSKSSGVSLTNESFFAASVTPPPTNNSTPKVQILKPKQKFKCRQSSDCKNEALCHAGTCFCSPGYTGESCDINVDECRQFLPGQPCLNNGTCIDEVNSFRCECPVGFRGERCQDLADMCLESPCLNNATCINHRTSFTCRCEPGWDGKHCEIDLDDCAKNPCQNGATCHDLINDYRCECPSGFTGVNCEININDCANNPCQNNATCRDSINDYECECLHGFTGKNCEENIDECFNSPCYHGKCTDLINGYKCTCHDGWTGEQCESDVDECETARPCMNGGSCENHEPSYQCHCREGYTGRNCSEISDYCKARKPCGKYGSCKNTNSLKSPFQCECQSGYIGKMCERKRDCTNECHSQQAYCVSNITCACIPGRREDRMMCEYVASCEQVEGELCLNGGACKNLDTGGYQCLCEKPFYGPICQFMAEKQFDVWMFFLITCIGIVFAFCAIALLVAFRTVRKARATQGTYSPSTQEKFGNSASDLLKPPIPERLI